MAFTYGFYNYDASDLASDAKLYDAEQISKLFDGIITDGVYAHIGNCFGVYAPSDSSENTVIIGTGRAWFNHTWNYNSENYVMSAPVPPSINSRIDALVIDVNLETRHNEFAWVQGTEASSPSKPQLTNNENHGQHAIAYVTRQPNTTVISSSDIERVVGNTETPFVTGILESLDASEVLSGLENSFDSKMRLMEFRFDNFITRSSMTFTNFMTSSGNQFNTWFSNIQGDVANNLINDSEWATLEELWEVN